MNMRLRLLTLILCAATTSFALFSLEGCKSRDVKQSTPEKQSTQLWTCGMHPQVIQEEPGECPICHMKLTPLEVEPPGPPSNAALNSEAANKERKIKYWWDPMLSPPYISDKPGKSPMGMDLVPVYEDEAPSGVGLTIDPTVVQNMGVRTAVVSEGFLNRTLRVAAALSEAQPNIHDVNLLVSGWIRRLYANTEGMHLKQGEPLFDLYSPELQVAIEELIAARRSLGGELATNQASHRMANTLYTAALRKLELWGLQRAQIETLAKLDVAPETVTFRSPITGHLVKKSIVEGAAVKAGDQILQVVDHSVLWADAQVFEQHLSFVSIGQKAKISVVAAPGKTFDATVSFIHPHLDMMTRTATVRFNVPNEALHLKPGMYATVTLEARASEKTKLVPREAVIDTGERQIAFVSQGNGHFEARNVTMGLSGSDGVVQILRGLVAGERVVTSGQFLLDAESRLREAVQKFLKERNAGQATEPAAQPTSEQTAR